MSQSYTGVKGPPFSDLVFFDEPANPVLRRPATIEETKRERRALAAALLLEVGCFASSPPGSLTS